jgi:hypothetical protein
MPVYVARIYIAVEADSHAEACDAVSEALRPLLREHEPESSVLDWHYTDNDDGNTSSPRLDPHGISADNAVNKREDLGKSWHASKDQED